MKRKVLACIVAGITGIVLASCNVPELESSGFGGKAVSEEQNSGGSEETKQATKSGGMDVRVKNAEFTDGLIQVCDMVLRPYPEALNYYDKECLDTVEGLIKRISSHSKEKFTIVNDDDSAYNPEKLIADGMMTNKLLVKSADGKVRLEIEYTNRSGSTCALKDCGANLMLAYDALGTTCELPSYIWRGINPNDDKWNYSAVTEEFKKYDEDSGINRRENNSYDNKNLSMFVSYQVKKEDDPMGIHAGTFGYEFVFNADTSDLTEVKPFYFIISSVMYFDFVD